jgi:large conductance mechanosensitive channel
MPGGRRGWDAPGELGADPLSPWPTKRLEGIVSDILKEFRDFLLRGNLIQLAVAFVIGVAFAAVINSFVKNLVMPIVAAIVGKSNFNDLTFTIHSSVFTYGAFITDVITFIAIAAAVFFFIVKPVDMITKRRKNEETEEVSDEERRHQELLAALRARA